MPGKLVTEFSTMSLSVVCLIGGLGLISDLRSFAAAQLFGFQWVGFGSRRRISFPLRDIQRRTTQSAAFQCWNKRASVARSETRPVLINERALLTPLGYVDELGDGV